MLNYFIIHGGSKRKNEQYNNNYYNVPKNTE